MWHPRAGKFSIQVILSISIITSLIMGPLATIASAKALSGVESETLVRSTQMTPDALGSEPLTGLQYADPAAQIDLVLPPSANNQGAAQLSHPLSVPPGRGGVQPELSLNYSSGNGNGWVGLGWELSVGEVTIDTRWGVPRYDPDKETESYRLDGAMLSPTAVRSELLDRQAERVFQRRTEGDFERIVRHGDGPKTYWWEITDKSGARRYYGGTPEGGQDTAAILADGDGNGFVWALKQSRDISGNTMSFTYVTVAGSGVGNSSAEIGRELYLDSILYTGTVVPTEPNDPAYRVDFVRASELGEPRRTDVTVSARGGFLRVTADLLRRVDIYYRDILARSYGLHYAQGPFAKTLLTAVSQAGSDGVEFARHTFAYYDDVRPDGSTYAGFVDNGTWTTHDDGVGNGIDLKGVGDGSASALGGAESLGGDGRAYIGFNPWSGSKDGSFGGAFVLKGDEGMSRLQLLDINGDNLQDKVFEEGDAVKYRLNTSGPNGGTTFGEKRTVASLSHLPRETNFSFAIGPEAYFGVNVMYNHAWSWSWGKSYFIDVNADGLSDFVDRKTVYFNHLDDDGNPVFTAASADTAVPIDPGNLDASVLPDLSDIEKQQREQAPLQDTLRRWKAPWDGVVQIQGDIRLLEPAASASAGDGVRVAIQHDGAELWSAAIAGDDYASKTPTGVEAVEVRRGADIYFRVQSIDDGASDQVAWDPSVTYLDVSPTLDANGLDAYSYQASADFTLAGRSGSVAFAPLDGVMRLEGDFQKLAKTTDDITVQVFRNGVAVGSEFTVGGDQIGDFPVEQEFDVLKDEPILLRLQIDSPVDLSAFSWTPRLYYLSATQTISGVVTPMTVTDPDGEPTLDLYPPVVTDIYPADDLAAPQITWTSPVTAVASVSADVLFCDPDHLFVGCLPTDHDGRVALTVKRKIVPRAAGDPSSELVAKQVMTVTNGLVTAVDPPLLTLDLVKDGEYWFDFSLAQIELARAWQSASVSLTYDDDDDDDTDPVTITPPYARHWAYLPPDVFPMAYRGWGVAGYNGDGDRAGQPIDESRLLFDPADYPQSDPTGFDDPNYKNPIHAKAYAYAPFVETDDDGAIVRLVWRGAKDNIFGSATGASSSRIGPDSIGLPGTDDLLGARAPTRYSVTNADAIAGGIGGVLGGSYAWGISKALIDFTDMNGDQFPDILGTGSIQYTTARGGLESAKTTISHLDDQVRRNSSTSKTLSGGGTAAEIKADSKGNANASQDVAVVSGSSKRSSANSSDTGSSDSGDDSQTGVSLGLSGNLGWSSTNLSGDSGVHDLMMSELADINGDSLPDLIRVDKDGNMTVAFNLGYRFADEIPWPGGAFKQGRSDSWSVGPSLGFSSGNLSVSGGFSVSSSNVEAVTTWVDLNGDGLLDQLRRSGDSVVVRFGTGAGLSGDVSWGDFRGGDIARSNSISLGGGLDFTIGIGPLCVAACYIIINPGAHMEGGMNRPTLEISDFNGDGYPDHLASTGDEAMQVSLNTTGRTNLLKSVANPLGGTIDLDYTRMGNTPVQPFSQWALSRVAVNDGRPSDGPDVRLTTYTYEGNAYNALEREFLGYRTVVERQHDTAAAGDPVLRSYERVYRNATVFDSGLLERETLLDAAGNRIKATVKTWEHVLAGTTDPAVLNVDPAGVGNLFLAVHPQMVKIEQIVYSDGSPAKTTYLDYEYDALGNVVEIFDAGEPALASDDVRAVMTYPDCTAPTSNWVAIPKSLQVLDGAGKLLRHRWADENLCANGAVTGLWEKTGDGPDDVAFTELEFDAWGNYNRIVYPENANGERYEVNYVYDLDRHTAIGEVTDSFGLVGRATYHGPTGQVASRTDANGQTTTYTYDAQGRLASITSPYEQGTGHASVTFEYFPTAPNYAYAMAHHFDAFHPGDPIDTVRFLDGVGRETQTKHDASVFRGAAGPPEAVLVVSGAVEFDALGRAVKEWHPVEEPLGTIGVYNTVPDTVSPTLTEYDVQDRVTKVTLPSGKVTTTAYGFDDGSVFGATMFLNVRTDPLGKARRSYLDVRGNLLAVSLDHDPATDAVFAAATEEPLLLELTEGEVGLFLPLIAEGAAGAVVAPSEDEAGPPQTYLPLVSGSSAAQANEADQAKGDDEAAAAAKKPPAPTPTPTPTPPPPGPVVTLLTRYVYNPLQQLTAVIDPAGNVTSHEYDLMGRRIATTTPDGGRVEFSYDLASQLIAKSTPNLAAEGGATAYLYDFNRLAGIDHPDGTPDVAYEFGGPGAPGNAAGRIVRIADGARIQTRGYGLLGEIAQETTTMLVHNLNENTEARLTWTMSFEHETWGRLVTQTYPDGEVIAYGYDAGGLLAFVAGSKAGVAYPYVNRLEYDKFGARRYQVLGNGVATEIRYEPDTRRVAGQVAEAPGRQIQDIAYTYDAVGNLLRIDDSAPKPRSDLMGGTSRQEFAYDDLYRLISASGAYDIAPNKLRTYGFQLAYDSLGNILRKNQTDTVFNNPKKGNLQLKTTYNQVYAYSAAPHQPTHIGVRTYTYDANGNLTGWTDDFNGQNRTVTWDAENRVTSVADQGSTTVYTYDDEGRLAIERGPQGETSFVSRFYTVRNGAVAWKHIWAGSERVVDKRQMPDGEPEQMRYFYHKDLLGSASLITDPTGLIFEHVKYFPGGETWVIEHSDIHRVSYLYAGGYLDEFRALYNFGARWYEPREQMLYSPDPALVTVPTAVLSDPALLAAYTYAEDNPMRLVDRDGNAPEDAQAAFRSAFSKADGSLDRAKLRAFNSQLQKAAEAQLPGKASRLVAHVAADPKGSAKSAFKAFATFTASPLLQINLKRTPDGLQLKDIKIAPFLFKQFTIKTGDAKK